MGKPKTYWIDPNPEDTNECEIQCFQAMSAHPNQGPLQWQTSLIPVIEYYAFQKLQAENEQLKKNLSWMTKKRWLLEGCIANMFTSAICRVSSLPEGEQRTDNKLYADMFERAIEVASGITIYDKRDRDDFKEDLSKYNGLYPERKTLEKLEGEHQKSVEVGENEISKSDVK